MSVDCSTYAGIDSVASLKSFPTPPPSSRWSAVLDVDVEEADVAEEEDSEEVSGKVAPMRTRRGVAPVVTSSARSAAVNNG